MKKAFLLLCVLAVSFAYTDPPMDEVMGHNFASGFLLGLQDQVPAGVTLNPDGGDPAYFNATLIGVFPSVEDRIPADEGTYRVLWTWGEEISDYVIVAEIRDGNDTFANVPLTRDPLETEYSFSLKVGNESLVNWAEAPAGMPYLNLSLNATQLEGYNATEKLEVVLEYSAKYHYTAIRGEHDLLWIAEENGTSNLSYYVENGNVTFFTVRPVLGEQWYRNNHFDNLVFSKKRIYKSEVYLDGVKVGSAHVLNFSIYNDTLGTWFINSSQDYNHTNVTMGEHEIVYSPTPLIHNNESFRYLYEENYSYSGIGRHNLTLVLTDDFGNNHTYGRELLSRAAGEQEAAEEGAYYAQGGTEYARPTYEKPEESLTQVIIPTGALAIIFIVVAASTWWGMTGAKRI